MLNEAMTGHKMCSPLMIVLGTRPQLVKGAAIIKALNAFPSTPRVIVDTGQHFDDAMSQSFYRDLGIPQPDVNLGIHGGRHGEMTGRLLQSLEPLMEEVMPKAVMVVGDTNSTLGGALAASKLGIPVAHVEAGLRSFNRRSPEEINRVVVDHLSDVLYCPTPNAVRNAKREDIATEIVWAGDVMYDLCLDLLATCRGRSDILDYMGLVDGRYALATVHRQENTDDPDRFVRILEYLEDRSENLPVVLPLHPRTRAMMKKLDYTTPSLLLCEPLGYLEMARVLIGAREVYTDSGGLQKEAYFHRVPCVTLRDETEWTETIEAGWNRLWTADDYLPRRSIEDFGAGDAARVIIEHLISYFNLD